MLAYFKYVAVGETALVRERPFMEYVVLHFSLEENSFTGNALTRKTKTVREKLFNFHHSW